MARGQLVALSVLDRTLASVEPEKLGGLSRLASLALEGAPRDAGALALLARVAPLTALQLLPQPRVGPFGPVQVAHVEALRQMRGLCRLSLSLADGIVRLDGLAPLTGLAHLTALELHDRDHGRTVGPRRTMAPPWRG